MKIPAVFMRGGTSKGVIFHARDLGDRSTWDSTFLRVMGSPDRFGRQLDGMGGGISSLSKVCVVAPPSRDGADVDYTFAQVMVNEPCVDYGANCGNMSSAIGPFAVDEGLVHAADGEAVVRIHNTNTRKIIRAALPVTGGRAHAQGDLEIPGVTGTGAPVRLEFLDPGGATTGRLLPAGHATQSLDVPGIGRIAASMVDAANTCCFVDAATLGLEGTELPQALERDADTLRHLDSIRTHASVAMGIAPDLDAARARRTVPFIGVVSPPRDFVTLSGDRVDADQMDVAVRMLSSGQPHRALPLTASLCVAVASAMEDTLVARACRAGRSAVLRIGMPSGVLNVSADVAREGGRWVARSGSFYRTARRLFDGHVHIPRHAAASPISLD